MSVFVRKDGCIHLGSSVTCDGFQPDASVRIQTHIHSDHMKDFDRSKTQQTIVVTPGTKDLLIAEKSPDLRYRSNVVTMLADGVLRNVEGTKVALYPSGHIVGGAMALVEEANGDRFAYSGDFSWPLDHVPQDVDVLVLDGTCGDPKQVRKYSQADVTQGLLDLVAQRIGGGNLLFSGHRGRLQAAVQTLLTEFNVPMIFTSSVMRSLPAFSKHRGFNLQPMVGYGSAEARALIAGNDRCFFFAEQRDRSEIDQIYSQHSATRVMLQTFAAARDKPVKRLETGIYIVAMTDHADFAGTIDLVLACRPKLVITDASRHAGSAKLAAYIQRKLGIPASADVTPLGREWGMG